MLQHVRSRIYFNHKIKFSKLEIRKEILTTVYLYAVHYNDEEENYTFYWP